MYRIGKLFLYSLIVVNLTVGRDAAAAAPTIDVPRVQQGAIVIDAHMNEPIWENAVEVDMNNITYPEENQRAPVDTKAYLVEDGKTLYIGFIAKDPHPEQIRASLRDRDSGSIWNDDIIGIKLDTYGDHKLAYQFWVNALGVQVDSIENAVTGSESTAWDAIWDSAGRITKQGYVVEIALPLRILNFNERLDKQDWKVELVRFYPRQTRQRISNMTIDPDNVCKVCQMGPLVGFAGAKQGKNLSVVPSLTFGYGKSRDIGSEPVEDWQRDHQADVGLDVKWGITPDISLNATVNPDYSQIEADVAQLSINNTFSLFFQEKRAFFLDNIDYFATPFNLVYTRNIGDPDYGAKLTGRIREHSFGLFAANDPKTTLFIPGNLGSSVAQLDDESQNAVLRYRFDPNASLSLGWIGTFRSADNYHNYVSGFDAKYKLTASDDFSAQMLYSQTEYPQDLYRDFFSEDDNNDCEITNCAYNEQVLRTKKDGMFSDVAYTFNYNHDQRDWNFYTGYTNRGEGFRADMGFNTLADWNKFVIGGNRIWRGEKGDWWSRWRFGGDWDITHDDSSELLEKESQLWTEVTANSLTSIYFEITDRDRAGDRLRGYDLSVAGNAPLFHETQWYTSLSTNLAANLSAFTHIQYGDEIDFTNNRLGTTRYIKPGFTWNPNKHLTVKSAFTYKRLNAEGAEVFTARLLDARVTYQFSVRSFVRLALIYSNIDRNQANYNTTVDSKDRSLATQLLYSYKLNPRTLFFVGYSDSAYADDQIDKLTKDSKTVFMKFSYAWLL